MDKPIRIRAASGEVIDLAEVRSRYEDAVACYVGKAYKVDACYAMQDLALLDALVAALSVPDDENDGCRDSGNSDDDWKDGCAAGANGMRRIIRQAARVVEETT